METWNSLGTLEIWVELSGMRTNNLDVEHAGGPELAADEGSKSEANAKAKHDEVIPRRGPIQSQTLPMATRAAMVPATAAIPALKSHFTQ
jgi:hypothetical protein